MTKTFSLTKETWDTARRLPGFDEQVGVSALLKLFELEPLTKQVFHIAVDHMPTAEELKESGNLQHAISMFQMFDAALNMLGKCCLEKLSVCLSWHCLD